MINTIYELLGYEEGMREKVYLCSEGYPTIGKGTVVGTKSMDISTFTLVINEEIADLLLKTKVEEIQNQLTKHIWFTNLNADRQIIITSMAYQMGYQGVLAFRKMIKAIEQEDWDEAAREMQDSQWYRQTTNRAKRHIYVMETGKLSSSYR